MNKPKLKSSKSKSKMSKKAKLKRKIKVLEAKHRKLSGARYGANTRFWYHFSNISVFLFLFLLLSLCIAAMTLESKRGCVNQCKTIESNCEHSHASIVNDTTKVKESEDIYDILQDFELATTGTTSH